jgi:glycosyltransferase involved in cell wall biosynthesis
VRVCLVVIEADHWRVERSDGVPAPVSGMGEVVRMTAQALHRAGADVIAALPDTPSLRAALEPFCSSFVKIAPATRKASFGRNVTPVLRLLLRQRPDIVHFHVPHYRWALDALIAANVARRTQIVRSEHNPMMTRPEQPYRTLLRLADAAVDRFVYVSDGNRERFERQMPWRPPGVVIPNAVDPERLDRMTPSAPGDAALAQIAAMHPTARKAVFVAGSWQVAHDEGRRPVGPVLEAMANVDDHWHLFIAGTGDQERAAGLAKSLDLGDRVHFLGPIPDAARVVASCDLLVSASHFEGLSVAYLEAWYFGLAVLSTPVDGIEDVVGQDRIEAITAPHGDTARLAELWRQATLDGSEFLRINREATRIVRDSFGPSSYSENLLAVYEGLLRGR